MSYTPENLQRVVADYGWVTPELVSDWRRDYEVDREKLRIMSQLEFLSWLGIPRNSLRPYLYRDILPTGIEYITATNGHNCFDYAQGAKGKHWLDVKDLFESSGEKGDLAVYFGTRDYEKGAPKHAGIVYDPNVSLVSQWGTGSVFKHGLHQVPPSYLGNIQYFRQPDLTNKFFQKAKPRVPLLTLP